MTDDHMDFQIGKTEAPSVATVATSDAARSAQLTLISILLAAILGSLFIGLPPNFAEQVLRTNEWAVDLRVLATLLAAIDLWIEYSWTVLCGTWTFSVAHNLAYFVLTVTLFGLGLTVGQTGPWLWWIAASGGAAILSTAVNAPWPIHAARHTLRHRRSMKSASTAQIMNEIKYLSRYLIFIYVQVILYFIASLFFAYEALQVYHVLPPQPWVEFSPTTLAAIGVGIVAADLLFYWMTEMPGEPQLANVLATARRPSADTSSTKLEEEASTESSGEQAPIVASGLGNEVR